MKNSPSGCSELGIVHALPSVWMKSCPLVLWFAHGPHTALGALELETPNLVWSSFQYLVSDSFNSGTMFCSYLSLPSMTKSVECSVDTQGKLSMSGIPASEFHSRPALLLVMSTVLYQTENYARSL